MRFARSLARERAFALALLSTIVVLLFGRTLLHGLTLTWWTGALFLWLFATVSLTIPAVLLVGILTGQPVLLGLTNVQAVMLGFTLLIGMNSYRSGETNALQGAIHFALFATFIALIFV